MATARSSRILANSFTPQTRALVLKEGLVPKIKYLLAVTTLLSSSCVLAEYCAIGKIEANECSGFIIESCSFINVDAVRNDEGQLFHPKKCYESVTEYNAHKERCWINTKSKGGGLISWGINAATQPNFLHKNSSGEYEEIDADYITFKCSKK
ncbi:hypothetical protein [Shewanella sp. Isolate7]|uniref:hypothetical protein n=1 Tax=Shewanella sp. Isolate7 TaxID=2908528 RepID=UPI001EFCE424|nr:hypothetical protein [Shewanella sp. Isolate7]MCG9721910.1 hypothetical protein [Shewanella sp. Isolate7]